MLREDFPILKRKINGKKLVYFDSAATSQKPIQVIDAVCDYYKYHNVNVHRGVHTLSEESTQMVENARSRIAEFIGANSEKEVIFVRNASEGINLVMYGWARKNIKKGEPEQNQLPLSKSNKKQKQLALQKMKNPPPLKLRRARKKQLLNRHCPSFV